MNQCVQKTLEEAGKEGILAWGFLLLACQVDSVHRDRSTGPVCLQWVYFWCVGRKMGSPAAPLASLNFCLQHLLQFCPCFFLQRLWGESRVERTLGELSQFKWLDFLFPSVELHVLNLRIASPRYWHCIWFLNILIQQVPTELSALLHARETAVSKADSDALNGALI